MPFPSGTPVVTLTGTLPSAVAGTGYGGQVVLTPSAILTDATRHAVYPGGGKADIVDGAFTVQLIPNNAAGISPTGWRWYVDVQPAKGKRVGFWADIHGANGATIQLDALVPAQAPGGGTTGQPGKSAYEIAVEEGYTGTVTEWLASLVGPAGATGATGATGPQGPPGADGNNADAEAYTDAAVATHAADTTSVHGIPDTAALETTSGATAKVTTHAGATDPHGDRAWASGQFATIIVVTGIQGDVTQLDGFVQDCLTRVAAIEQGTAFLSALNVAGNAQVVGNLTVTDFVKGYRFRVSGSSLDLEATGTDLIISNWSGTGFNGTQRSYFRLSADAQNIQAAGKVEFVDALYGATRHVLDGAANTAGFFGASPVGRQTVNGSRGGNAALASLLTALDMLGLIDDNTTA